MSKRIDDLIQLMRLSGTDKVRAYLEDIEPAARKGNSRCGLFLYDLEQMFTACKRSDISEAWPSLSGGPACAESVQPETTVQGSGENPAGTDTTGEISHRCNVEDTDTGVRICRGNHHRSSDCEWEYYRRAR